MNLLHQLRLHARSVLHSTIQDHSVQQKESRRAAKSASLFLTMLFKCTTLCCKVLFQNCYTIESRRLRVCWSDAQSDTKRYPKQCPNMSYVTTGPRATQTNAGPQDRSKNSKQQYYKVLLQYYSVLQSTTPVLLRTTKY